MENIYSVFTSENFKICNDKKILNGLFERRIDTKTMCNQVYEDFKNIDLPFDEFYYKYMKMISHIDWLFQNEDSESFGVFTHPDGWQVVVKHDTENTVAEIGYNITDWWIWEFEDLKNATFRQECYENYLEVLSWLKNKYFEYNKKRDFDIEKYFGI